MRTGGWRSAGPNRFRGAGMFDRTRRENARPVRAGRGRDCRLLSVATRSSLLNLMTPSLPAEPLHEPFSLQRFAVTVVVTFAALVGLLAWLAPGVWAAQVLAPFWRWAVAFAAISFVNCFVEYVFHRYVLHLPTIPLLSRLYRQHTLHHALTRIARRPGSAGRGILYIENKFPIVEEEQHEAAFFPWYSMAVFAAILAPLFTVLQLVWPAFPWFIAGLAALASSLTLYELLHAINHWPLEVWEPLITHRRWGWFWRPIYGFHLRHHAVIDCNESISGFFGLPLADWLFGTCMIPQTVYADGEEWLPDKFQRPQPCALIRKLDTWAAKAVERHRVRSTAGTDPAGAARLYSSGEKLASGLTHGLAALLSVVALTLLIILADRRGEAWHVVSFTVFGVTLLLLHTISLLSQTRRGERGIRIFRRLDHAAIFLLIAGTYTPFLLTHLRGPLGWTLFGAIWGICGAGAVFKVLSGERWRRFSTLAYLVSGWLIMLALKPLVSAVPVGALWLLLAGGLCYAAGAAFYCWSRLRYHRTLWNTLVMSGSACHFFMVFHFLLPRPV